MRESKMRVTYISSFATETLHSMINRALLEMLCELYPGSVDCHASGSTMPALTEGLEDKLAGRKKLYVPRGSRKINSLLRFAWSAFHNIRLLLKSRRDDLLFFNLNNVFALKTIDLINRRLQRRIIICCHGELEYLLNADKHRQTYKKLMARLTRNYFSRSNKHPAVGIRFLVFGDIILRNIKPLISQQLADRFSSIDHPLIPEHVIHANNPHDTINIGTVGIMNGYKGAAHMPKLASLLTNKVRIQLHVVGHMQCDTEPFVKAGIMIPDYPHRPLDENEFRRRVDNLDYILLLYPSDTYRLIASGAILDCIRFRKPVLALRTEYFNYLFKKYGSFGYLADSIEELALKINTLSESEKEQYHFSDIASSLSPHKLAPQLREIIQKSYESTDS